MEESMSRFYEFGSFCVDTRERSLLHEGKPIPLTPKAFEILSVLVQHSGQVVEKERLLNAVWPDSFVEEGTLAQNIFILRKVLGESRSNRQYIETVPKRGYRFMARVRESDKRADPGADVRNSKAGGRSLAVLPFKLLTPAHNEEYLGLGMADALITQLSNVARINVRPTSTILRFNDLQRESITAGKELKVDLVLEGEIQRLKDRVRVTVQLVNVENGAPLWAGKFDEQFVDIFAMEDTISGRVVEALALKLTSDEKRLLIQSHSKVPEAFQENLKGRYQWNKWTEEGFKKSAEHFARAIKKDPEYAQAYIGLADSYNALGFYSYLPPREAMPQARAAAEKALEIDETRAEAHRSLAEVLLFYDWNWLAAKREIERAIELNPGYALVYQVYSSYLIAMGQFDEAEAMMKRAIEMDPVSPIINTTIGCPLYFAGQYDRALEQYQNALNSDPNFGLARACLGDVYVQKELYEHAIAEYENGISHWGRKPGLLSSLGYALAMSGNKDGAVEILEQLRDLSRRQYVPSVAFAIIYIGLGDKDQAFDRLQRACSERSSKLVFLKVNPNLNSLRSDPRFAHLLRRVGLP